MTNLGLSETSVCVNAFHECFSSGLNSEPVSTWSFQMLFVMLFGINVAVNFAEF